ncbi:MAG TPA: hypothetical protein VEU72_00545 [Nitrosopumilaceae archaeon]|nr:hypothetical protein [Nitrosopumilaceae archaeon]
MFDNNEEVKKVLVTLSVEKALLDIGKSTYDNVLEILNTEYHCYLPDCYEHPEYLNKILSELYDNIGIVESITKQLEEFNYHEPINKFLKVICNYTTKLNTGNFKLSNP